MARAVTLTIPIDNVVLHHDSTCNNSYYGHALTHSDNSVVRDSWLEGHSPKHWSLSTHTLKSPQSLVSFAVGSITLIVV